MSLKKLLKYSSIFLIILSLCICSFLFIRKKYYLSKEKEILVQNKEKNQRYTKVPYIEIPSLKISKLIENDASQESLDKYTVAIWNKEKDLSKVHHLILAGHNVKTVFGPLHRIQIGDFIYIYYKDQKNVYEVVRKIEIKITETEYLEETTEKYLSLVTCTDNNQTRLLVDAKIKEP